MSRERTRASRSRQVPRLAPGDLVGVVATGFAVDRHDLEVGIEKIETLGYRTRVGRSVLKRQGYLAGSDEARAADLGAMIGDSEVRAIWFARGGYGTARILDAIPWRTLIANPKLLIGYSDLTALFNAATRRAGVSALYGPVVTELGRRESHHVESLRSAIAGEPYSLRFGARDVIAPGRASGRVIGGNLSVLAHLCGTRFAPDPTKSVLFLEEIGEQTYRVDRALNQLRQSGLLDGLVAVIVGHLVVPARDRFPPDRRVAQVLREYLAPLEIPVVRGLPLGHRNRKRPIPIGEIAVVDTSTRCIEFPRRFPRARVSR